MLVMKFGGASLADSENFNNAIDWIFRQQRAIVVVSAMKNVTNELMECLHLAEKGNYEVVSENLNLLRDRHAKVIRDLIEDTEFFLNLLFLQCRMVLLK